MIVSILLRPGQNIVIAAFCSAKTDLQQKWWDCSKSDSFYLCRSPNSCTLNINAMVTSEYNGISEFESNIRIRTEHAIQQMNTIRALSLSRMANKAIKIKKNGRTKFIQEIRRNSLNVSEGGWHKHTQRDETHAKEEERHSDKQNTKRMCAC